MIPRSASVVPFRILLLGILLLGMLTNPIWANDAEKNGDAAEDQHTLDAAVLRGLTLRSIGPAINSGRVVDVAVTPGKRHRYFVAVASGGVWKTENAGTTWTPVFDNEGSFAIGCVTIDPNNPNVVWVGTGENNSQRSVAFGDGVYKSVDGGQTWRNMGLEDSGHIGMVVVDPRDSNVVYVAAMGPLWNSGGDRGVYKSTDGGETWNRILHVSDNTGAAEVHLDPRDPDVVYATSWQRRRHVWTLLNGGPESGFHKSTDGGETWRQIDRGLPSTDRGRMGLCISPVDNDVIYGILDAERDESGLFRSTDRGESWTKRSDHATSGDYWNELFCDPHDLDTVYSVDVWLWVTKDGGASFERVPSRHKHVDDHVVWLDPEDPDYMLVGCDGGMYESFDRGDTWHFKENLPITQFYRVAVDNAKPFYNVYGGTQDNNSMGGPSRTLRSSGISNEDWFITVGGDGYESQVDPTDPNIVYAQWQYGGLVRYDKRSGEVVDIQPQEAPGDDADRWNWDSPLVLSPHQPTRLYYASQRIYRSDDRGNGWRPISGDLSRQLDRDQLPVMDRIWEMDAIHKNKSTSDYGNITSLTESTRIEGLLYVGTDDGLIQVRDPEAPEAGDNAAWRAVDGVKGVPENTYVTDLEASLFDDDTVYASFNNKKKGDFTPYIAVSRDRGRTWTSMRGDMPDREIVYTLIQDHEVPSLLFAGTEFSLYVTLDEGEHWHKLKGGLPTIQVRDLDIQREWNDLALATFGRGYYILDDYTPLRALAREAAADGGDDDSAARLFPIRTALRYIEQRSRIGSRGHSFWTAENPPYGAVFTYWLRDGLKTLREQRLETEKEARADDEIPTPVASMDELRTEDLETAPAAYVVVRDAAGAVVRRVEAPRKAGLHRVAWDLRWPSAAPTELVRPANLPPWVTPDRGPLALPGRYSATLEARVNGDWQPLTDAVDFEVEALALATLKADDVAAMQAFQEDVRGLRRAVLGASRLSGEVGQRINHLRKALADAPDADPALSAEVEALHDRLDAIQLAMRGDATRGERNVFTPPSIVQRVERIVSDQWWTTQAPTQTHRQAFGWATEAFAPQHKALAALVSDLEALEARAEAADVPWTPGRMPTWSADGN
ncbi:MAG: glycosyl hydrolase [Acidobacteriota bacterium]